MLDFPFDKAAEQRITSAEFQILQTKSALLSVAEMLGIAQRDEAITPHNLSCLIEIIVKNLPEYE